MAKGAARAIRAPRADADVPIYTYKAIDGKGRQKTGTVDADTPREAREKLRRQEIRVTEMDRMEAVAKQAAKPKAFSRRAISVQTLAQFTSQFSTLLRSGVHLAEGLGVLIQQSEDRKLEIILRDIRERVVSGASLADALAYHPRYFSDLYVNIVRAGEASGNLDKILDSLAYYLESQAKLRSKILNALTYPAVMVFFGTGVVVFLVTYVVPKLTSILLKNKQVLPPPTLLLIGITDFIKNWWWAVAIALAFGVINLRVFLATEKGRLWWDTLLLRVPLLGTLFKKQAISRFCVTFGTLLRSGLPAHEALLIVGRVVNNALLARVINEVHDRILEGADISTPIRNSKIFPPLVAYMVSVGEQSGQLETVLDRIAERYESEIDNAVQRLTGMMEPLIIVALAVVVGFIVMAILLPMLQMNQI